MLFLPTTTATAPSASPRISIRGVMSSFPAETDNSWTIQSKHSIFPFWVIHKYVYIWSLTRAGWLFFILTRIPICKVTVQIQELSTHFSLLSSPTTTEHSSFCTLTVNFHLLLFWNPLGTVTGTWWISNYYLLAPPTSYSTTTPERSKANQYIQELRLAQGDEISWFLQMVLQALKSYGGSLAYTVIYV